MKKKERLLIGKRIHDSEFSIGQCVEQRWVSRETAYRWLREYRASVGLKKLNPASKPLGVSATALCEAYESMGKPELIRELMRRDIEVARLKKGYSVKGVVQGRSASFAPARIPSDRRAFLEMAGRRPLQGDVGQQIRVLQMAKAVILPFGKG